jgi:hypothetical protein
MNSVQLNKFTGIIAETKPKSIKAESTPTNTATPTNTESLNFSSMAADKNVVVFEFDRDTTESEQFQITELVESFLDARNNKKMNVLVVEWAKDQSYILQISQRTHPATWALCQNYDREYLDRDGHIQLGHDDDAVVEEIADDMKMSSIPAYISYAISL